MSRASAILLAAAALTACDALTGTHHGDRLHGAVFSEESYHGRQLPAGPPSGSNLAVTAYLTSSAVSFDGHGTMTVLTVDSLVYPDSTPSYRVVRDTSMYTYAIVDDSIGLRDTCFDLCAPPPFYRLLGDTMLIRRYPYWPADSSDVFVRIR